MLAHKVFVEHSGEVVSGIDSESVMEAWWGAREGAGTDGKSPGIPGTRSALGVDVTSEVRSKLREGAIIKAGNGVFDVSDPAPKLNKVLEIRVATIKALS